MKKRLIGIWLSVLFLATATLWAKDDKPLPTPIKLSWNQAQFPAEGMTHDKQITNWIPPREVTWEINTETGTKGYLSIYYSALNDCELTYEIPGVLEETVQLRSTGDWKEFRTATVGTLDLPPGTYQLILKNIDQTPFIRLKSVECSPKIPKPFSLELPPLYASAKDWPSAMLAMRKAVRAPNVAAAQDHFGETLDLHLNPLDGKQLWTDFPKEIDWFLQDNQVHGTWGRGVYDARQDIKNYLNPERDTTLEQKLIEHVLPSLGSKQALFRTKLDKLTQRKVSPDNKAWLELYIEACHVRRQLRLKPLLDQTDKLVYATHMNLGTIYLATETQGCPDGSQLRMIDLSAEAKGQPLTDELLFDADNGILRDPEISWDGKKMLFAWRKTNEDLRTVTVMAPPTGNYKIYEMDLATREIKQLTTDETYGADTEPCYLPNGNIIFSSVRCVHEVTCGWGDCSNLFLMDGEGNYARRIGFDQTQSGFPHVLNDGRVVFTRRDYNDRGQSYGHCVMVMNIDGTSQTEYYGNNSMAPTSLQHIRPIPGSRKTMGIAGGYHTSQGGKLVVIDPTMGTQNYEGLEFLNWEPTPLEEVTNENYCRVGEQYAHPFPMSEKGFLVSFDPMGGYLTSESGQLDNRKEQGLMLYKLYYMTLDGERELLASHDTLSCTQGVPMMARKKPQVRSSSVDYTKETGICYVQNVYYGPSAEGIKPGSVKKLRVVKLFYKPITIGAGGWSPPREMVGPLRPYSGYGWHSVLPTGVGSASWDTKQILGEVDVHEDGSAMFEVPARSPIYFQLVDDKGLVVQTMRSWATLMPNETFSCVGCHEDNDAAPLPQAHKTLAMQQAAQKLQPLHDLSEAPFSYVEKVQPIWDRHCISCHSPGNEAEKIDLTDTIVSDNKEDRKSNSTRRKFYQSYLSLLQVKWVDHRNLEKQRLDEGRSNEWVNYYTRMSTMELTPPYFAGSTQSKIIKMLQKGHGSTQLTNAEIETVAAWIDLNVPFVGQYDEMNIWDEEATTQYHDKLNMRHKQEEIEAVNIKRFIEAGQP